MTYQRNDGKESNIEFIIIRNSAKKGSLKSSKVWTSRNFCTRAGRETGERREKERKRVEGRRWERERERKCEVKSRMG